MPDQASRFIWCRKPADSKISRQSATLADFEQAALATAAVWSAALGHNESGQSSFTFVFDSIHLASGRFADVPLRAVSYALRTLSGS